MGCWDLRRKGLSGAVDGDGCRSQRPELLDDVGYGQAGTFLDVVGYFGQVTLIEDTPTDAIVYCIVG